MKIAQAQDEQLTDQLFSQRSQDDAPIFSVSQRPVPEELNAFLGKGVHFTGTLTYQGTIRIDGAFDGEIRTDGVVLIGEEAKLKANVTAGTIVSKGRITGDIRAKEKFMLQAPSVIVGEVTTPALSIEEGARIDGNLKMEQDIRGGRQESTARSTRSSKQFSGRRIAL